MTPTSIAERLDALALEATEGIELADPRESRRRWGVAPLLAAACLVVIAGLAVAWLARDVSHERIEIRTDEGFVRNELPLVTSESLRPPIFDTTPLTGPELPDWFVEPRQGLGARPEVDRSELWVGPEDDEVATFVALASGGSEFCLFAVAEVTGVTEVCASLADLEGSFGAVTQTQDGTSGFMAAGLVPADVIGVRVGGERALLGGGVFVLHDGDPGENLGSDAKIELERSEERQKVVDSCNAYAEFRFATPMNGDMEQVPLDVFREVQRVTTDDPLPGFAQMGEVLGDLESPADLELLDEDQLEDWLEAHQTLRGVCISQRVPGWAPAYLDRPALALSPEVDLAEYGVVQPLGLAEREPELVFGPGLGVVRRAELIDREIVIAWWTKREGGQILNASGATFATGTSMGQSGGSVGGANQPMVIDNANNVGLGDNFLLSWPVRSDAAFVTVVVGNERWVQQPISQIAAFVLPGRSAVLTQYDANGDVLRG